MKKVVVIGDVIEDIIVISEGERKANTDNPSTIQATPGGSGANFAVWLASLGVETQLIARVGSKDKERLDRYFTNLQVIPKLQIDQNLETGKIVVLVEANHRTFFTDRAANTELEAPELPECDLLYLSGYSVVTLGSEKTQSLVKTAKNRGSMIAVDPGSTSFIQSFGVISFLSAVRGADMIFPNQDEYELLNKETELSSMFQEVVVTKGAEGAELVGITHVQSKEVAMVDPTGAGDAFAAKYIAERLLGTSQIESLNRANDFAAQSVTTVGGQPSQNA